MFAFLEWMWLLPPPSRPPLSLSLFPPSSIHGRINRYPSLMNGFFNLSFPLVWLVAWWGPLAVAFHLSWNIFLVGFEVFSCWLQFSCPLASKLAIELESDCFVFFLLSLSLSLCVSLLFIISSLHLRVDDEVMASRSGKICNWSCCYGLPVTISVHFWKLV